MDKLTKTALKIFFIVFGIALLIVAVNGEIDPYGNVAIISAGTSEELCVVFESAIGKRVAVTDHDFNVWSDSDLNTESIVVDENGVYNAQKMNYCYTLGAGLTNQKYYVQVYGWTVDSGDVNFFFSDMDFYVTDRNILSRIQDINITSFSILNSLSINQFDDDLNCSTSFEAARSPVSETKFFENSDVFCRGIGDTSTLPTHYSLSSKFWLCDDTNGCIIADNITQQPFITDGILFFKFRLPYGGELDTNYFVLAEVWDSKTQIGNDIVRGKTILPIQILREIIEQPRFGIGNPPTPITIQDTETPQEQADEIVERAANKLTGLFPFLNLPMSVLVIGTPEANVEVPVDYIPIIALIFGVIFFGAVVGRRVLARNRGTGTGIYGIILIILVGVLIWFLI